MTDLSTLEQILLLLGCGLLLFFFVPRLKVMLEQSKQAPKDWQGFLLPIGGVIIFVLFLLWVV